MPENIPFEKKELIVKIQNPNHLPTIDFHELKELQGDLKITTPAKIEKLKKSIIKYGVFVPKFTWIDNGTYYIEDGHQTVKALTELEEEGYTIPPIPYVEIQAEDRKDAGEKLLMINSRFADINPATSFFKDFGIGLEFMEEIEIPDLELDFEGVEEEIIEDEIPEAPEEPITQVGDLWLCDKHRVLCGDATKAEDVERLMGGKKADMVFTDPPYGISVVSNGKVGGGGPTKFGKIRGRNRVESKTYHIVQGDESTDVAKETIKNLSGIKNKIIFGGNYFTDFLPPSRCWLVWDKENTGNFADAELMWTSFDKGVKLYKWLWNGLSRKGGREIEGRSRFHPTQKPVGLFGEIISDFIEVNTILIDPFLGSGTTLIAAHQLKRTCYGMEIEPKYADVTCQRFFNLTGIDPIRESDGKKWSELQKIINC